MSMSPMGVSGGQSGQPFSGLFSGNEGTGKGSGGLGMPQQASPAISPYIMQLLQARLGPWAQQLSQGLFSGGQGQNFNPQSPGMIAQRQQEAQIQQQIAQRQQQAAAPIAAKPAAPYNPAAISDPNDPNFYGIRNLRFRRDLG